MVEEKASWKLFLRNVRQWQGPNGSPRVQGEESLCSIQAAASSFVVSLQLIPYTMFVPGTVKGSSPLLPVP